MHIFTNKTASLLTKAISIFLLFAIISLFNSCGSDSPKKKATSSSAQAQRQVNLYTSRYYSTDTELFKQFEERTGIHVNVTNKTDKELLDQIQAEAIAPQGDVVIFSGLSYTSLAKDADLLQPFFTETIDANVPSRNTDYHGKWVGLSKSPMAAIYVGQKVDGDQLNSYVDIIKPEWKDKVILTKASNPANIFFVASMLSHGRPDAIKMYLQRLVGNQAIPPLNNDFEVIQALAEEKGMVGFINASSLVQFQMSGDPEKFKIGSKLGIKYLTNSEAKTFYNLSTASVLMNARNRTEALALIEFLTDKDIQTPYCDVTFEYPVNVFTLPNDFLLEIVGFKEKQLNFSEVGNYVDDAIALMKEVGWE